MRFLLSLAIAQLFIASFALSAASALSADFILPAPKTFTERSGQFDLSANTAIRFEGASSEQNRSTVEILRQELLARTPPGKSNGTIVLHQVKNWPKTIDAETTARLGDEGYILDISDRRVVATARTSRGLFYAAQTLIQLREERGGRFVIGAARIVDWPDIKNRMVLYDLRYNTMNVEYGKRWIRTLGRLKINQLMIFMSGDYMYRKYPFIGGPEKLTPEKLTELQAYARRYHVQLIPQIESLGHAEGVLSHEQFRDMRLGENNNYAYSPCTRKTYSLLTDLYSELIQEFGDSTLFHVGGDEVWDFAQDERCKDAIAKYGETGVYTRHFQRLARWLKPRNRQMAIWSDMILHHPEAANGLPRDTIIFDWHYEKFDEFPSLAYFKKLGFKNIYASPSVHGFMDAYPWNPFTFRNVNGFTKAALREGIDSVCVTVWEMHRGGNAEPYLYGVGFSGQVMWHSQKDELKDFNRRFASFWFDTQNEEAAGHVDRLFWFPWRSTGSSVVMDKDNEGALHDAFMGGDSLFLDFAGFGDFARDRAGDKIGKLRAQAVAFLKNARIADESRAWLAKTDRENEMTFDTMAMSSLVYQHIGRKIETLSSLAMSYRDAFATHQPDQALAAVRVATRNLEAMKSDFPELRRHFELAIRARNSDPAELTWLAKTAESLDRYVASLEKAEFAIGKTGSLPAPSELGL